MLSRVTGQAAKDILVNGQDREFVTSFLWSDLLTLDTAWASAFEFYKVLQGAVYSPKSHLLRLRVQSLVGAHVETTN